jgi:hypothetical protein
MVNKLLAFVFVVSIICYAGVSVKTTGKSRLNQEAENNTQWVARSLKEMETIKLGATRGELLNVFTEEGGLSTPLHQTFVYKQCRYFKVDVEFRAVGRPARDRDGRVTLIKSDADVITKISKPYLAWSVMD